MKNRFATSKQEKELLACIIRKFPNGRVPAAQAKYLIEHPEDLSKFLLAMVTRDFVSGWQELFGQLHIWDSDFNEAHYPLEPETETVQDVEEYAFKKDIVGNDAIRRLESKGYALAGVRAAELYIKKNPDASRKHQLIVGGAKWQDPDGGRVCVPIFRWDGGEPSIELNCLDDNFNQYCRWLVSRKSK